jgi:type II secretory pathway predicted ATPase ExeA
MIRSHFGLLRNPFDSESITLLAHQQEIFDILRVHAQQGGLCLVLGEPGIGKSVLKQALLNHDPKRMITPVVNRTLHTYHNTLRLLCEDFPHSHNLVLIGQPPLLQSLALSINEEIRSRVTYSVVLPRLSPETIEQFILSQMDRAGLGHNTFTAEALALIVRSGEGLLRRTRNLSLSSLIEAVRDQTRIVDLKQVNRVLVQPHWRKDCDTPLLS